MYNVYLHIVTLDTGHKKYYVGQTKQEPEKRWGKNGINYKTNKRFYSDILKYGWDNIKHDIIATDLSKEEADKLEIKLINKYESDNYRFGYNYSAGGHLGYKDIKWAYDTGLFKYKKKTS